MELYFVTLSNNTKLYAFGKDEMQVRDIVNDWVEKRFFGGKSVSIDNVTLLADGKSRGQVPILLG